MHIDTILPLPPPKKKIVPNGKLTYDTCMTNKQTYYKKQKTMIIKLKYIHFFNDEITT